MSFVNSNWRAGMARVSQSINAAFGEPLEITPCHARPNYAAGPYADKAIILTGVIAQKSHLGFEMAGSNLHARVENAPLCASFSRLDLPWAIHYGDRIKRLCDGQLYEVASVSDDDVSRVECKIKCLGRPQP
ncbi:hypothetical protein [Methylocystis sp.]|uniref:hypothetical protein n=1 Tax=Methylocystis sp. TaxID=1911079 RepID=UPI003DA2256E